MKGTNRRTFVKVAGAMAVAPAVAGCTGGDGSDGNGNGNSGGNGDGNGGSDDGNGGGDGSGDVPAEIDDYLSGANLYDGTLTDMTGEDEVTVDVGASDNGLAFGPPAVRIDAGTTITWEWTGEGGAHNVVDEDGAFESELVSDEGETFEYTFEEAGNYRYYCEPHKPSGMKGGVVVE